MNAASSRKKCVYGGEICMNTLVLACIELPMNEILSEFQEQVHFKLYNLL